MARAKVVPIGEVPNRLAVDEEPLFKVRSAPFGSTDLALQAWLHTEAEGGKYRLVSVVLDGRLDAQYRAFFALA